ncbi:hypothetical protein [Sphingopyxis lindanitolerans]|uniref:hypothetical protein n=1 Tax=Sphingopyxis lindanitolerans TaxID=2054227 RepID=UPI001304A379|nr:hypothetical protein [Sphingopyxis lindanitolerans]
MQLLIQKIEALFQTQYDGLPYRLTTHQPSPCIVTYTEALIQTFTSLLVNMLPQSRNKRSFL